MLTFLFVMPRFFEPEWPKFFEETLCNEEIGLAKFPARDMVRMILDNNFEKKVLSRSGFMMLIEGFDVEHLDADRVIRCGFKSDESDLWRYWSHTREGVILVYFDQWNWVVRNHRTGKEVIEQGSKLHNELCEFWWSLMYNEGR